MIDLLLKISKKDLEIDFIESGNAPKDYVFDTGKMNMLLGDEMVDLVEGLEIEYKG